MKEVFKNVGSKPIAYYPMLNEITGGMISGVLLSQLLYWWKACKEQPFYKTDAEFCEELFINIDQFRKAKQELRDRELITTYLQGLPAKTYYNILIKNVEEALTSLGKTHESCYGKPTNILYTENTREYTSEKKSDVKDLKAVQEKEHDKLKNLPLSFGNAPLKRLIKIYSLLWTEMYGFAPTITNWGQLGKQFKPMFSTYSEYQLAAMVIIHFDWKGADGDDDFTFKVLKKACFPLDRLPKNADAYKAFLINFLGMKFDEPEEIKKYVVEIIKPLIKK